MLEIEICEKPRDMHASNRQDSKVLRGFGNKLMDRQTTDKRTFAVIESILQHKNILCLDTFAFTELMSGLIPFYC